MADSRHQSMHHILISLKSEVFTSILRATWCVPQKNASNTQGLCAVDNEAVVAGAALRWRHGVAQHRATTRPCTERGQAAVGFIQKIGKAWVRKLKAYVVVEGSFFTIDP